MLITSDRGGRTFEITRRGEIVWQWVPPFHPTRSRRYPDDHCPQLASLKRPKQEPVRPAADYRHIDEPIYRFTRKSNRETVKIGGQKLSVLKKNNHCTKVLLPAAATLQAVYGLNQKRIRASGRSEYGARFSMRMWPESSQEEVELFADTVDMTGPTQHTRTIGLGAYAYRWVWLCVETAALGSPGGQPTEGFAYWTNPAISVTNEVVAGRWAGTGTPEKLTEEEMQVQREHLKALGYVD